MLLMIGGSMRSPFVIAPLAGESDVAGSAASGARPRSLKQPKADPARMPAPARVIPDERNSRRSSFEAGMAELKGVKGRDISTA
jgi:hypothetical protein